MSLLSQFHICIKYCSSWREEIAKIPMSSYFVLSARTRWSGKAGCNITSSANGSVCRMMKLVMRSYAWDFRIFRTQGLPPYLPIVLLLLLVIIHVFNTEHQRWGLMPLPPPLPPLCSTLINHTFLLKALSD